MWLISLAFADCMASIDTHLDTLESGESVTAEAIDEALPCYAEALTPPQAARVHHLYAAAHADSDPARAARHLYAAWEAQPFLTAKRPTSDAVAHELVRLQEAPAPTPVASPSSFLQIDGSPSTWTRSGRPALVQGTGRPASLLDDQRAFVAPVPVRDKKGPGLWVAGLASAAVGGGLYAGAWASNSRYQSLVDNGGSNEARQSSHDLTNALSIGSVVGAVAGAGLLTVHFAR
jgi:hypothetical protein